jgi:uncharacterized BrkB/YihY/UPF0761 family membrane protein
VLALFPLLLFLVTLTGLVLRFEQIELILEVGRVAPADATRIIARSRFAIFIKAKTWACSRWA